MSSTNTREMVLTFPNDLEYVIVRDFDAPRELVFNAWTRPEEVSRWFGPHGHSMRECDIDLRVGGRYRMVDCGPDGTPHPFIGEYREIDPPARLVYTWIYDVPPFNEHSAVITLVLDDVDGHTRMTATTTCDSKETRDAIVATGMEGGARESYERLDSHLTSLT